MAMLNNQRVHHVTPIEIPQTFPWNPPWFSIPDGSPTECLPGPARCPWRLPAACPYDPERNG